ncbi:hypothetical protein ACLB2K_018334 [Fragaria x ananassa]
MCTLSYTKESANKKNDEGERRSTKTCSTRIWVKLNTADLSKLILKEWNRKKNEHLQYKNAHKELMTHSISHINRTWKKVMRISLNDDI